MKALWASISYALRGLITVVRTERNMKIHVAAALAAFVLSVYFRLTWQEFLFVTLSIALVMTAEVLNTAIETVVDFVSPEYRPLAGMAKDMAAGAVLLAVLFSIVVGFVVFSRRILGLF